MSVIQMPDMAARMERVALAPEVEREFNRLDRQLVSLFHSAKRRAAKLHRTPPWADLSEIWKIYREAHRMWRKTGIKHHVDHVIPLQGELVSGLHVPANLQVIPWRDNLQKCNKFEVV